MKISLISCILVFCFAASSSYAQSSIAMSYGDPLPLQYIDANTSYKMEGNGNKRTLAAEEMNLYRFNEPGTYTIDLEHQHKAGTHDCSEHSTPNKLTVIVDSFRLAYLQETMKLSQQIYKQKETEGIFLLIDIDLNTYTNSAITMPKDFVLSSGIETNIKAKLDEANMILKPGHHTLKYWLSGMCQHSGYIQFDFLAPKGRIIPIGLTTKILE
jgi:hypothetical protein